MDSGFEIAKFGSSLKWDVIQREWVRSQVLD
jgi:hypothetical protein